jgi:hypothetical protein
LQALDGWEARHRHSYSVQVGGFLAEHLTRVVGEIRAYLDRLREAAAADGGPEPGLGRGTVWLTRILGVLALAGLVAGPVLGIRQLVPVRVAILIGVLPLVVWLAVAIGCYVRERREIFRDLHGLRTVRSEVEAAEANLRQATLDARRLADAYAQYLVWSRVVGAVLAAPFGPPARAADPGVTITHGLPRTTQVARARVDERATAHAAAVLRSDVFVVGWLGRLWREHLQSAGARLTIPLAEHPEALVDLRSGVEGSPLAQWADVLAREGTSRDVGDQAWGRVMDLLRGSRHDLAAGLLSSVQALGHDGGTVDLDRFLAGVDRPEARGQEFDAEHFTANAQAAERSCVEIHEPVPKHRGLSRTDVLVQLTQVWRPWDFAVTEQATDDVEAAHVRIPHGAHRVDGPVDRVPVPRAPEGYR